MRLLTVQLMLIEPTYGEKVIDRGPTWLFNHPCRWPTTPPYFQLSMSTSANKVTFHDCDARNGVSYLVKIICDFYCILFMLLRDGSQVIMF